MSLPGDKTLPTPSPSDRQLVQGYGPGRFRISEVEHRGPVVVTPLATTPWAVAAPTEIAPANVAAVMDFDPKIEVLLVGCGAKAVFVPSAVRAQFRARGVTLEVMDTGAACRTYNVLLAESRRVGAALFPLP